MHYLVTGGAGFIGPHLAEKLLDDGRRIKALDNLSTGLYENIAWLKTKPHSASSKIQLCMIV